MSAAPDQAARDRATDIARSVIVQAPAGSGKTTLLVERYLKLLAVVDKPEEILAITFTRKAAGEMATRVLDALKRAAAGTNASTSAMDALARSDALGWHLTRHPARLKIQTIDSLALSLTRGLPIASRLDPSLGLTENAEPHYARASAQLLLRLYEQGPLTEEIADFLRQCDNDAAKAERLLSTMLSKRDQWLDMVGSVVATHQNHPDQVAGVLRRGLERLNEAVIESFEAAIGPERRQTLEHLVRHAATRLGRQLESRSDHYRLAGEILTTKADGLRKQVTKREGFSTDFPEEKSALLALIDDLRQEELTQLAASLRHLPDERLSPATVERLVNVCVNLALANAELGAVFTEMGETDFTTLILNARTALGDSQAPTELALALDYRIHHMLVDEFQDTSVSQFQLFEKLLRGWTPGDGNTFFAVGDPMQSIYRFRDADVGLYYRAWNHGIADLELEQVVLTSNFRAAAPLVGWTNHAFSRIMGSHQDPVLGQIAYSPAIPTRAAQAADPVTAPVRLRQLDDPAGQVEDIVAEIGRLLNETDGSIALLVRSRGQLTDLIRALRAHGIGWRANDIDPLLDRPAVRDLLALIGALADPYDRLSWLALLRAPFVGLTLGDLQHLAHIDDFPGLLGAVRDGTVDTVLSDDGTVRLAKLAQLWPANPVLVDELPVRSVVETLWLKLGGADAYDDPASLTHAARALELLETLGARELSIEALKQAGQSLYAADLSESRLEILTIHKAKGLEFDHVLLPFLERTTRSNEAELLLWRALPEGLLMGVKDDDGPFEWLARENRFREKHERQRLFYVACTRARRSLTLFTCADRSPPDTAMLSMLWPQLEAGDLGELRLDRPRSEQAPVQPDFFAEAEADGPTPEPPSFRRLTAAHRWHPPAAPDWQGLLVADTPQPADPLEARVEVVLGIVVHRALESLAASGPPDDIGAYLTQQRPVFDALAAEHDLSLEDQHQVVGTAMSQLARVLEHPEGRWLLTPRPDARAEFALTGLIDGEIRNLVIDRTFVEPATGERWVVDFKTAIPPPDVPEEVFLSTEISRYRPQLERYGRAAALLFEQPVRLALYFTALPRLTELTS
jgi:ATP-dependent exoDNAse (exonuclease V) beta subunit